MQIGITYVKHVLDGPIEKAGEAGKLGTGAVCSRRQVVPPPAAVVIIQLPYMPIAVAYVKYVASEPSGEACE